MYLAWLMQSSFTKQKKTPFPVFFPSLVQIFRHFSYCFLAVVEKCPRKKEKKRKEKEGTKREKQNVSGRGYLTLGSSDKLQRRTNYAITFVMGQHSAPITLTIRGNYRAVSRNTRSPSSTKTPSLPMERSRINKVHRKSYVSRPSDFNVYFPVSLLFLCDLKNDETTMKGRWKFP